MPKEVSANPSLDELSAQLDAGLPSPADPEANPGTDVDDEADDPSDGTGSTDDEGDDDQEGEYEERDELDDAEDDQEGTDPDGDAEDDDEVDEEGEDSEYEEDEEVDEADGEDVEDGDFIDLSEDLLSAKVRDPKRGDVVTLQELVNQRVTRDDYRERATAWRREAEEKVRQELAGDLALAQERRSIERDFTTLPIEYTLAAATQAVRLGIAPPQFAKMVEQAVGHLVKAGLYDRQSAIARAQAAAGQARQAEQQQELEKQRASLWYDQEDALFRDTYGVQFAELPEAERRVIRAAYSASDGSPRLAELYQEYFADRANSLKGSGRTGKPVASGTSVKGGTSGKKAPVASMSNRKLISKLRNQKRSAPKGRSAGQVGTAEPRGRRGRKESMDSLSRSLDKALGI